MILRLLEKDLEKKLRIENEKFKKMKTIDTRNVFKSFLKQIIPIMGYKHLYNDNLATYMVETPKVSREITEQKNRGLETITLNLAEGKQFLFENNALGDWPSELFPIDEDKARRLALTRTIIEGTMIYVAEIGTLGALLYKFIN